MKKMFIYLLALSILSLMSCSKNDFLQEEIESSNLTLKSSACSCCECCNCGGKCSCVPISAPEWRDEGINLRTDIETFKYYQYDYSYYPYMVKSQTRYTMTNTYKVTLVPQSAQYYDLKSYNYKLCFTNYDPNSNRIANMGNLMSEVFENVTYYYFSNSNNAIHTKIIDQWDEFMGEAVKAKFYFLVTVVVQNKSTGALSTHVKVVNAINIAGQKTVLEKRPGDNNEDDPIIGPIL